MTRSHDEPEEHTPAAAPIRYTTVPPESLTRGVDLEVSLVYFRAAHEAAKKEHMYRKKAERLGRSYYLRDAAMFANLAEGHLRSYREAKPPGTHRGGTVQ